jgi:hypothetical protein
MWTAIGVGAVVLVLIGLVIWYARREGIKDERLEQVEEGQKAVERETEMVDRWTGRNLLRALRRVQQRRKRDAPPLRPPD